MKPSPVDALTAALGAIPPGAAAVQLRERDLNPRELLALGRALLPVCRARQAPLLINDRIDVALALDADGVHLRTSSFDVADARHLLGSGKRVAVSCHGPQELARAQGADFVTLGPLFQTPSKKQLGQPLGLEGFAACLAPGGPPAFALGGINLLTGRLAMQHGAAGLAAIRACWDGDPAAQVARLFSAAGG